MNQDAAIQEFEDRKAFRAWLEKNHARSNGIWVILKKGSKEFSAKDALEEAICFGWIDGVMKSINEDVYKKYFSRRKNTENWSEKNIKIFHQLKERGLVTKAGIEGYKARNDQKTSKSKDEINEMNINQLKDALKQDRKALILFDDTPPSRQKQLAGFYCDAKTEETREKRKGKIIEALTSGYKGMLY